MSDQNILAQSQYIILDNIRSAHNVGAIFRTAEGAGVKKIYLCGYTPRPIDRFGRKVTEIQKTSLGASDMILWEAVDDVRLLLGVLKSKGVQTVAVELGEGAVSLYEFTPARDVAYLFGNEITGITKEVCDLCDLKLQIPMRGEKESLNVATTVGIIVFHHSPVF
ncbi:MAG: TrmH family RNA methyltransferase [Candidatus Paceibacteria bacterium]